MLPVFVIFSEIPVKVLERSFHVCVTFKGVVLDWPAFMVRNVVVAAPFTVKPPVKEPSPIVELAVASMPP